MVYSFQSQLYSQVHKTSTQAQLSLHSSCLLDTSLVQKRKCVLKGHWSNHSTLLWLMAHSQLSHHPKDLIPSLTPSLSSSGSEDHRPPLCPPRNHPCEFCPFTLLRICYRSWPLTTPQCLTLSRLLLIPLSFSSLATQSYWVHRGSTCGTVILLSLCL